MELIEFCSVNDLSDGGVMVHDIGEMDIALFRVGDLFFAMNDLCTHGSGSLSEGYLDGYVIQCDVHDGSFDIRTGEVVSPPCVEPARTYPVTIKNNKVFVEINDRY